MQGVKLTLLMSIFFPKNFFEGNSADKIWSKKDNECKVSQLMPIKVKDAASLKLWDGMYLKLSAVTEMPE